MPTRRCGRAGRRSATGLLGYFLQNCWLRGTEPERPGSGHESLCPYQAFATADGPINLGVANDGFWRAFCDLANALDLANDPRFATNGDRVAHRKVLIPLVADILARRGRADWLADLAARGIPSSPVHTLGELSAHPHTAASGMVVRDGDFRTVAAPLRIDGERLPLHRRPPALGEHSRAVLTELGYAPPTIDALIANGAVGSNNTAAPRRCP